jgi:hypothetical protein
MKRYVFLLLLLPMLSVASIAHANSSDKTSAKEPIYVFSNSDGVGIGTTQPLVTLDLSRGEVKIGSTGEPCTHTLAGTLRYAAARLQLCNGQQWRNISLDTNE